MRGKCVSCESAGLKHCSVCERKGYKVACKFCASYDKASLAERSRKGWGGAGEGVPGADSWPRHSPDPTLPCPQPTRRPLSVSSTGAACAARCPAAPRAAPTPRAASRAPGAGAWTPGPAPAAAARWAAARVPPLTASATNAWTPRSGSWWAAAACAPSATPERARLAGDACGPLEAPAPSEALRSRRSSAFHPQLPTYTPACCPYKHACLPIFFLSPAL